MTAPTDPTRRGERRPITPEGWMRAMVWIVGGMTVVGALVGISLIIGAVALTRTVDTARDATQTAKQATRAVSSATKALGRRSVVLDTTGCSVQATARFLDVIGDLLQLDRTQVAERQRLLHALDTAGDGLRACAPSKSAVDRQVEQVTRSVQQQVGSTG